MRLHIEGTGGLPADRDVSWIAAESGDVRLYPAQCHLLVEQAVICEQVTFVIGLRMRQPAQDTQTIVHCDNDDIAGLDQATAVVCIAGAGEVAAAMEPDDHGELCSRLGMLRRVDVQGEAVLIVVRRTREGCQRVDLGALRTEPAGVPETSPGRLCHRRSPPQVSHRRFGVRNAAKLDGAIGPDALYGAGGRVNARRVACSRLPRRRKGGANRQRGERPCDELSDESKHSEFLLARSPAAAARGE